MRRRKCFSLLGDVPDEADDEKERSQPEGGNVCELRGLNRMASVRPQQQEGDPVSPVLLPRLSQLSTHPSFAEPVADVSGT